MAEEVSPESKVYVKEKIETKRLLSVLVTTVVLLAVVLLSGCQSMDSDGDRVPDQLEINGYLWKDGQFRQWDGNPKNPYYQTDPTQWSTDQDAFPDGMEASGSLMDVSVKEPGDNPLVPAYPNIVVRLESYAVTLNEDISYTKGGSLAKGSTWNRQTTQTSSRSTAHQWETGLSVTGGYSWGLTGGASIEVTAHAKYGQTHTSTQSTSTAVSVGNSVLDTSNWARARASNPTRAAHLKLSLKVHNYGTACASNIIPTLTLRIGGINVATFEPGNAQINMLVPGGQYPTDKGVYWVVDSIDTGAGITPLYLTLDELRALERGAPVSLGVTQLKADVMLRNRSGEWANAGDCGEYLARCEAVGANIQIEIGDGSFVHHLVYADDAPAAPRVTLRDALTRLGVGADGQVDYRDTQGTPQVTSIDGYSFVFDQETLRMNGWDMNKQPAKPPAGEFDMADMVLGPGTSILIRSPRESSETGPAIHYASADPRTYVVQACVSDYDGISRVQFFDKEGHPFKDEKGVPLLMGEDIPGSGFFNLAVPASHYVFDGTERVIVTNLANEMAERFVDVVYYESTAQPEKPVFNTVIFRYQAGEPLLYANVTNPTPAFPIKWVKAFSTQFDEGVMEMEETANAYEDPNGWAVKLSPGSEGLGDLKVVAYVQPGVYEETIVSTTDEQMRDFSVTLQATYSGNEKWLSRGLDLDSEKKPLLDRWKSKGPLKNLGKEYELTAFCDNKGKAWRLYFTIPFVKVNDLGFDEITEGSIKNRLEGLGDNAPEKPDQYTYSRGDIFVFRTSENRFAKLRIRNWDNTHPGDRKNRYLYVRYVVYPKEEEEEDQTESEKGP